MSSRPRRHVDGVRAVVVVTTDKCYENREWPAAIARTDVWAVTIRTARPRRRAELVAASYRASAFFSAEARPLACNARAGNVIGGGDWSEDRLIPDLRSCQCRRERACSRSLAGCHAALAARARIASWLSDAWRASK